MNEPVKALQLAVELEYHRAYEAAAELRRLHQVEIAFNTWIDKTQWVQETSGGNDLGKHRADVIKQRLENLNLENKSLREDLNDYQECTMHLTLSKHELQQVLQKILWHVEAGQANIANQLIHEAKAAISKATGEIND